MFQQLITSKNVSKCLELKHAETMESVTKIIGIKTKLGTAQHNLKKMHCLKSYHKTKQKTRNKDSSGDVIPGEVHDYVHANYDELEGSMVK